jgi:formamidopyrimidine-DNA glycosylase
MTGQLILTSQDRHICHPGLDPGSSLALQSGSVLDSRLRGNDNALNNIIHDKHTHHIFILKKNKILKFNDVRKFATISLLEEKDVLKIKNSYGVDPIDEPFSLDDLGLILEKRKNKPIKSILMDNSVILGIGNIYASEILFEAKIAPNRSGNSLDKIEIKKLHNAIKKILTKAILLRGTSVSDYRDSAGKKGSFQHELTVYKKHGLKCKNCDTMIAKTIIGQRSTFHCPNCQI